MQIRDRVAEVEGLLAGAEATWKTLFATFRERKRYYHTPDRKDCVIKVEKDCSPTAGWLA